MAQSTVLSVGAALIAIGALEYSGALSGMAGVSWIIGGVVAIIVGMATKNMK